MVLLAVLLGSFALGDCQRRLQGTMPHNFHPEGLVATGGQHLLDACFEQLRHFAECDHLGAWSGLYRGDLRIDADRTTSRAFRDSLNEHRGHGQEKGGKTRGRQGIKGHDRDAKLGRKERRRSFQREKRVNWVVHRGTR